MEVTMIQVLISRDKMTKAPQDVWPWELAVLEQKYADGLVEITGEVSCERDSLPDADSEYIRLVAMYGTDERTGATHMERCYGVGKAGMEAFAKTVVAGPKKAKTKAKVSSAPVDPLS